MNKPILYVAAGNYSECLEYQKLVPEVQCLYITDVEFLRGRTPADIKVLPLVIERYDYVGVMESVDRQRGMWKEELEQQQRDEEGTNEELYY